MNDDAQIKGADLFLRQKNQTRFNGPTIICDGLQTPDNLGSILRVADSAGSQNIILLDSSIDLHNKKITRLARNANQAITIKQLSLQSFSDIRESFSRIIALEITRQSKNLFESKISNCDAIVIGHESTGIRKETLTLCHACIHLPMFGINGSMNISHAAAIFLYEWRRQKNYY